ncbi:uncharacterized protein LOC134727526 [Mytilus trossulus]|uniref:uncharacterized protein LOC134727526 n=1 Tax=Mytilus trossulus TaxID=6551 RepID=UPI0030048DD1
MNKGLETGKGIAEMLENIEFDKFLSKIGKSVGGYLGAIGPFIGFIIALFPSESKELAYMKEMMKAIDRRFDRMDRRFDNIEQMIKWSVVKISFGQIEQKIKAMTREFEYLYSVPPAAVENRRKLYISNYDSDYQNSGTKLYQSIVNKQGTFQEDLGTSVMRFTKNDRKKTQVFLLGVMQLLLQAVKIELSYLFAKIYTDNGNFMTSQWINRIQEVRTRFEHIDVECINIYFSQSSKDIDEYSAKNYGKPNKQFANELYNLLSGKYYWRDWIVVSYNPIYGRQWHMMRVTGGQTLLRKHGRNLLVTSVDKNHPVMNVKRAKKKLNRIRLQKRLYQNARCVSRWQDCLSAKNIYNSMDKTGASLVSVIVCRTGLAIRGQVDRLLSDMRWPFFWLVLWG